LKILLVEDDLIEIMKMRRVLSLADELHELIEVHDGEQALKLLSQGTWIPDIILLDLNMPRMDGIEFLSQRRMDSNLKFIPIIILTTSSNQRDLQECYSLGISGYVLKPLKYEDYVSNIQRLFTYWSANEFYSLK
jgi:CheY-like chemotaxis protein